VSVVIDASVALKWVLDESGKEAADALLEEELIAPSLWLLEAANALWRRRQREEINDEEAKERLTELYNAPVTTTTIEDDLLAAADLANVLGHPERTPTWSQPIGGSMRPSTGRRPSRALCGCWVINRLKYNDNFR